MVGVGDFDDFDFGGVLVGVCGGGGGGGWVGDEGGGGGVRSEEVSSLAHGGEGGLVGAVAVGVGLFGDGQDGGVDAFFGRRG